MTLAELIESIKTSLDALKEGVETKNDQLSAIARVNIKLALSTIDRMIGDAK